MNKNYNTHLRSGYLVDLYRPTCKIKCERNMSLHESGQESVRVERVKVEAGRCEAGEMSPYCGLMEFRWGCKQWSDPVVFCWTLHDLLHSFHLLHANKLAFPGPCRAAPLMLRGRNIVALEPVPTSRPNVGRRWGLSWLKKIYLELGTSGVPKYKTFTESILYICFYKSRTLFSWHLNVQIKDNVIFLKIVLCFNLEAWLKTIPVAKLNYSGRVKSL